MYFIKNLSKQTQALQNLTIFFYVIEQIKGRLATAHCQLGRGK